MSKFSHSRKHVWEIKHVTCIYTYVISIGCCHLYRLYIVDPCNFFPALIMSISNPYYPYWFFFLLALLHFFHCLFIRVRQRMNMRKKTGTIFIVENFPLPSQLMWGNVPYLPFAGWIARHIGPRPNQQKKQRFSDRRFQ